MRRVDPNVALASGLLALLAAAGLNQRYRHCGVELGLLSLVPTTVLVALRGLSRHGKPFDRRQLLSAGFCLAATVSALVVYPVPPHLWIAQSSAVVLVFALAFASRVGQARPVARDLLRRHGRKLVRAFGVSLLLAALPIAELAARGRGFEPWNPAEVATRVEPGGRFYEAHPELGYTHLAGKFKVTLSSGYAFDVTHGSDTLRVTRPAGAGDDASRPGVWLFGCSFTHGWALNDDETYPWLVQAQLPGYDVRNFGVGGYGNVHSLLQLREALERRKRPEVVVLAYMSFHDERNTFQRTRRKAVVPYTRLGTLVQPYGRVDAAGKLTLHSADNVYRELPFMRASAFMHLLEITWNEREARALRGHEVSHAVINEIARACDTAGVKFVLANVWRDAAGATMLARRREAGGLAVDLAVDLTRPENTNLPHDSHPSALANRHYATTLVRFLRETTLGR